MEVPGQRPDIYCQPCSENGCEVQAAGFCQTCSEYLCQACYNCHKKMKVSRNHVLLDKSSMSTTIPLDNPTVDLSCKEICAQHTDKLVEYYCTDHGILGCNVCTTINHRNCNIKYIPDIAKDYKGSEEYEEIVKFVDGLKGAVVKCENTIKDILKTAEDVNATALSEVRKFRKDMNVYFDKLETAILTTTQQQKVDDQKLMSSISKDCKIIDKERQDLNTKLQATDLVQLFSTCKRALPLIGRLRKDYVSITEKFKLRKYHFNPSSEIKKLMAGERSLGELVFGEVESLPTDFVPTAILPMKDISGMDLTPCAKIDVSVTGDKETPRISGLQMLNDNEILMCDCDNSSIKILNTKTQKVTSHRTMSSWPWDVVCIPDGQAAVTLLYLNKIAIVATTGTQLLSTVREIPVTGVCCGITYTDNKLIVSYRDPGKVEVLGLTGDVLHTIAHNTHGEEIFKRPHHITTQWMGSETFIYVTDAVTKTVTKTTLSGQIISQYKQEGIRYTTGIIALGNGKLAVCDSRADTIHLLKDNGLEMTLVKKWKCVKWPLKLVLSPRREKLYVSSFLDTERNFLHVHTLTDSDD